MMGGIDDFLATITEKQNYIIETGLETEKRREAYNIYDRIYSIENSEAMQISKVLQKDISHWTLNNESYVNPRTAFLIR